MPSPFLSAGGIAMSLLMLFVDGLGLGAREGGKGNPLLQPGVELLRFGPDIERNYSYRGGAARSIDATMGVPGLPQSATGQTAIFTGVNTARLLGRHLCGWPNARLRRLLEADSIFLRLRRAGKRSTFANAFTPAYFLQPPGRMSASTLHMLGAGLRPRWVWQIAAGEAVFQDFSNRFLIENGFDVPEHSPEAAAAGLAGLLGKHDFVLYEFFLTDAAAHRRIDIEAAEVVLLLERMLRALLETADLERHCVMLCSDHGNIEDASSRSHTANPVPLVAWGRRADEALEGVESITGIADAACRCVLAG